MKYMPVYLKETGYEKPDYFEYLFEKKEMKERATTILKQLEGLDIVDALDFLERCKQAVMQSKFSLRLSLHKDMDINQEENER